MSSSSYGDDVSHPVADDHLQTIWGDCSFLSYSPDVYESYPMDWPMDATFLDDDLELNDHAPAENVLHEVGPLLEDYLDTEPTQSGNRVRKLGTTKCLKYKKKRRSATNHDVVVEVEIPEEFHRVVGENSQRFITRCGFLVRQLCPLNTRTWATMDGETKKKLISQLKTDFKFPNQPWVDDALNIQCRRQYRVWRYYLKKKYYYTKETDDERITNCPPGVDFDQWKWIVLQYWSSNKATHNSQVNRVNGKKVKMPSRVGTKSAARIVHDMRSAPPPEDAEPTEYLRLFVQEKMDKKTGRFKENYSEEAYKKLKELHAKQVREHGVDELTTKEAFSMVLGEKLGRLLGMGEGVPPLSRCSKKNAKESLSCAGYMFSEADLNAQIDAKVKEKVKIEMAPIRELLAIPQVREILSSLTSSPTTASISKSTIKSSLVPGTT